MMQEFEFKLDKVLEYNQQEEDMIQQRLAQIRSKLQETQEKLQRLINTKSEIQAELRENETKGVNVQQAVMYRNYLEELNLQINQQRQVVSQIEERFKQCRQELLEKTKDCQMLDKLKEREYQAHRQENFKKEQKIIDELATNCYLRHNNSEAVI
ncbi:MAG: flagellar export protein FliJ [Bacillota bacterium]